MRKILCLLTLILSTILLSIVAFSVFPFDRKGNILHGIERLWAKIFLFSAGIDVYLSGQENLSTGPYVLMCNHQSALDIFVLLASLPFSFRFVAKSGLFKIPFMGWAMKCVGHISIDRENLRNSKKAFEEAKMKIKKGLNVLIFPEGTRSENGTLLPFKRGAFHILGLVKVPVVPLAVYGSSLLMPKGKVLPLSKGNVRIEIGKPINSGEEKVKKSEIMERIRKEMEILLEKARSKETYAI